MGSFNFFVEGVTDRLSILGLECRERISVSGLSLEKVARRLVGLNGVNSSQAAALCLLTSVRKHFSTRY